MNYIDWIVISIYAAGLIWLSWHLSKGQTTTEDYYLGGKTFKWWQVGLSTMATQLGAVSFISAPAFVGLRENGGLQWLTYEFAVPLAMILLVIVIFPPLYRSGVISIYTYLEKRFNKLTRQLLSGVFQFSRAFAAGITVYAVAIVLEAVFQIPLWINIVAVGIIALLYDYLGGMKAVVISDVIQMGILFLGFLMCSWFAWQLLGGWEIFIENLDRDRLTAVDFSGFGVGDGSEFGFWPMLLGGFFLYAAYYGCDQSQAQRILASMNMKEVRKALVFNGLARFPTVLLYCVMGLLIGTFALMTPEFLSLIPADRPDYMVPYFIVTYLPHGLIGLLVAAIMAAAMSSLDSALNSLSAATVEDFVIPARAEARPSTDEQFSLSKKYTIFWGVICVLLAFAAGNIAPTVIEAINKIGSLFYGPIIATFVLGMLTTSITGRAVNFGIIAGVLFNMVLWLFFDGFIFWFWWNFTGFAVTVGVAFILSRIQPGTVTPEVLVDLSAIEKRPIETLILGLYFVLIVAFSVSLAFVF
ncbi:transporter, SSS family [Cyclonatronum proteinivorum]|uniref:Transporter, SSS family n=1 Tax=Cyclonatronum proteinivorum TaxID=1457365 RepID=A0A345UL91_9BACT|nr:sodium/solute symporter [Cyclonatronum proteinivorum]AXJ01243.1 transporter, SSS family [Cyclonatronum proteinivorum]